MPRFFTINKFCREYGFPVNRMRQWIKEGRLNGCGWYSGNRFMIDSEMFFAMLKDEADKRQEAE